MITPELLTQVGISAALFLLVWALIGNLYLKPFFKLLDEREARTSGDEKRAQEKRLELQKLQASLEEALRETRVEGVRVRDAYVQEAREQAQGIVDKATEASQEELERSRAAIQELKQQAQGEVEKESSNLAELVVSRVLSQAPGGQSNITVH